MAIFTNQATLFYNDNVVNSNIATGELIGILSANKVAVVDSFGADDDVTYIISIVNTGTTAHTGLTITDNLGAYIFDSSTLYPLRYITGSVRYYVNGVLQPAPIATAGPPLTISGINVPAGGNAIIVYSAATTVFAPLGVGGTITNVATISGCGLATPIDVTETVTASTEPRLTISKTLSPSSVAEDDRLTYTFIIQNLGNTAADVTDNVRITDTFNPILSDIVVTFNGVTLTEPEDYTYNESTGVFATVQGRITVPAATYTQDETTGVWTTTPGVSTLVVTGTV